MPVPSLLANFASFYFPYQTDYFPACLALHPIVSRLIQLIFRQSECEVQIKKKSIHHAPKSHLLFFCDFVTVLYIRPLDCCEPVLNCALLFFFSSIFLRPQGGYCLVFAAPGSDKPELVYVLAPASQTGLLVYRDRLLFPGLRLTEARVSVCLQLWGLVASWLQQRLMNK